MLLMIPKLKGHGAMKRRSALTRVGVMTSMLGLP